MRVKSFSTLIFLVLFWPPQKVTNAGTSSVIPKKTIVKSRLDYNLVKYDVIQYEIKRTTNLIEKRLNLIKNNKS